MSDSAHLGDAARLEAALERIVGALGRAKPSPIVPPDSASLDQDAQSAPPAIDVARIDVAQIGARLDGLIAELRDVLGEDAAPPDAPSHPA